MNKKKNRKLSPYEQMVINLSHFVNTAAIKDNPTAAELNAMVEMAKLLFKTI